MERSMKQMTATPSREENTQSLLLEVQTHAALSITMKILQKAENWSTTRSSYIVLLRYLSTLQQRYLLIYVHCYFLFI